MIWVKINGVGVTDLIAQANQAGPRVSGSSLMAPLSRFNLPGWPQHVIQRDNDREACFGDRVDWANPPQSNRVPTACHSTVRCRNWPLWRMREATSKGGVWGDERFRAQIQATSGRPSGPLRRGADRKSVVFRKRRKRKKVGKGVERKRGLSSDYAADEAVVEG